MVLGTWDLQSLFNTTLRHLKLTVHAFHCFGQRQMDQTCFWYSSCEATRSADVGMTATPC